MNIWERAATEGDRAWDAFQKYRNQVPPRKRMSVIGYSIAEVYRWCAVNAWVERVRAYDGHFDAITIAEREDVARQSAREVAIEHMALLGDLRQVVAREAAKYLSASHDPDFNQAGGLVKPHELARLADIVIKYDRLVRDQTTEQIGTSGQDLSKLSIEELRTLKKLREKLNGTYDEPHLVEQGAVQEMQSDAGEPDAGRREDV